VKRRSTGPPVAQARRAAGGRPIAVVQTAGKKTRPPRSIAHAAPRSASAAATNSASNPRTNDGGEDARRQRARDGRHRARQREERRSAGEARQRGLRGHQRRVDAPRCRARAKARSASADHRRKRPPDGRRRDRRRHAPRRETSPAARTRAPGDRRPAASGAQAGARRLCTRQRASPGSKPQPAAAPLAVSVSPGRRLYHVRPRRAAQSRDHVFRHPPCVCGGRPPRRRGTCRTSRRRPRWALVEGQRSREPYESAPPSVTHTPAAAEHGAPVGAAALAPCGRRREFRSTRRQRRATSSSAPPPCRGGTNAQPALRRPASA